MAKKNIFLPCVLMYQKREISLPLPRDQKQETGNDFDFISGLKRGIVTLCGNFVKSQKVCLHQLNSKTNDVVLLLKTI